MWQALLLVGLVSFISILGLALVMAASIHSRAIPAAQHSTFIHPQVKAYQAAKHGSGILPRTHATAYFVSLLISNFIQSIGSILNLDWLLQWGTVYEPACVAQGAFSSTRRAKDPLDRDFRCRKECWECGNSFMVQ